MRWSNRPAVEGHAASSPGVAIGSAHAAADELIATLSVLHVDAVADATWFRSLENCRRSASELRHELDHALASGSVPLRGRKLELARRCAEVYWLLGQCYLTAAAGLGESEYRPSGQTGDLLQTCYQGLLSFAGYLLINYQRYARIKTGVWMDIHRLYNIAAAEGAKHAPVESISGSRRTVAHEYKRLLLLGLSDPFHHAFGVQAEVFERLDDWAEYAVLTTHGNDARRHLFIVDPLLDRPAAPALSHSEIRPFFNEQWLDTGDLVEHLKRQHRHALKSIATGANQTEGIATGLDEVDLLRQLIVQWGLHPIRRDVRRPIHEHCEVVVGFKSVCTALNGFEPVTEAIESNVVGEQVSMLRGTFGHYLHIAESRAFIHQWEIADQSDHGFRLITGDDNDGSIAIGDLVAVRPASERGWRLGYIHWASSNAHGDDDRISLGIRTFMLPAEAAAFARLGADGTAHFVSPGLMLTDRRGDRTVLSLLCGRGAYSPDAMFLARFPRGEEYVLKATNVLLSTRGFTWFEVAQSRLDTRQRALDTMDPYGKA